MKITPCEFCDKKNTQNCNDCIDFMYFEHEFREKFLIDVYNINPGIKKKYFFEKKKKTATKKINDFFLQRMIQNRNLEIGHKLFDKGDSFLFLVELKLTNKKISHFFILDEIVISSGTFSLKFAEKYQQYCENVKDK